jgi:peptidylprolyl isomerase
MLRPMRWLFIALAVLALLGGSPSGCDHEAEETPEDGNAPGQPVLLGLVCTTESGLRYLDATVGAGRRPQPGQYLVVHYTGWLTDGSTFDSSWNRGQPFIFPVGQGLVIAGWEEGVAGMRVGGQRRLIIPPELGYGSAGPGGGLIPPDTTLIFDVELLDIRDR